MIHVDDVTYFTRGYCFALALELHARAGFPLRVFHSDNDHHHHALVKLPDGQFLDVRGIQNRDAIKRHWGPGILRAVGPDFFKDWSENVEVSLGKLGKKRLNRVANKLLQRLVTLKCTECPAIKVVSREPCFYDFTEVTTICPRCEKDPKKKARHDRLLVPSRGTTRKAKHDRRAQNKK